MGIGKGLRNEGKKKKKKTNGKSLNKTKSSEAPRHELLFLKFSLQPSEMNVVTLYSFYTIRDIGAADCLSEVGTADKKTQRFSNLTSKRIALTRKNTIIDNRRETRSTTAADRNHEPHTRQYLFGCKTFGR